MVLKFEKNKRAYVSDLNNLAMMNRNAVRNGCEVVAHSPADMGVRVSSGSVFFGQNVVSVAEQDLTINESHQSYDRIDLIVVDNTGTASVIVGTPEQEPHTPDYDPLNYVVLARIWVDDLATTIETTNIVDLRVLNEGIGTFGKYVESGITSQTSVSVMHNLNDYEPVVICYDESNRVVIPESIVVNSDDEITVTFNPAFSGKIVVQGGSGGTSGGAVSPLTIREQDGSPTVLNVDDIKVSNGTLTDEGDGTVSLDLSGTPGTYIHNQTTSSTTWVINHNLGQQVVQVQCYDSSGYWIQPHSIQLNDANTCTVTLLSSESGQAIVKK